MTREDLHAAVASRCGHNLVLSEKAVTAAFNFLRETLGQGGTIGLKNLCTFTTREKSEIRIRNNRTGADVTVPAHKVVLSRFARSLRLRVAGGLSEEGKSGQARGKGDTEDERP
jgi:nucleoid DNA-binding protein